MENSSLEGRVDNFSKSSMSVVELNNYIVSMRGIIKRARSQTIQKLVKQIKQFRGKKGSEEQLAANNKKADRLLGEVTALKKVNIDKVAKYCLGNTITVDQASTKGNVEEKVFTRIACNKLVSGKVGKWRQEHADWESLAAFAMSKNTGRRYKKKSVKSSGVTASFPVNDKEPKQNHVVNDDDDGGGGGDGDDVSWNSEDEDKEAPSSEVQDCAVIGEERLQLPVAPVAQDKKVKIKSAGSSSSTKPTSAAKRDVVVKQIRLDELSDEELFLPPPDDEKSNTVERNRVHSSKTKLKGAFFVLSSDDEVSDSASDGEDATSKVNDSRTNMMPPHPSSVKSSTVYTKSLSDRGKWSQSRSFQGKSFNTFKRADSWSDGKKGRLSERGGSSVKFNSSNFRNRSGKGRSQRTFEKNPRRNGDMKFPRNSQSSRAKTSVQQNKPLGKASARKLADEHVNEKLHPSWAASKQRKEREKNLFVFAGQKKVFGDDD